MSVKALCALLMGVSLGLLPEAMAQSAPPFAVGDRLTPQEVAQFAKSPPLRAGELVLREISSQSLVTMSSGGAVSSGPVSLVVNEDGQVGESRNELVISQVPVAELQQRLQPIIRNAVTVQYDVSRAITVLRFSSLSSAVRAHNSVLRLWPHARVALPVRYGP